jgi:hypothetical protein
MFAFPAPIAVMRPVADTLATDGALLVQLGVIERTAPDDSTRVAEAWSV